MLIVIYGNTGSGKDYLARSLKKVDKQVILSPRPTTRPKREKEESTYDFFCGDEYQFISLDLVSDQVFNNWRYGVYAETLEASNMKQVLVGDKAMTLDIFAYMAKDIDSLRDVCFIECVADPSLRAERLLNGRGEDRETLLENQRRMASDERDYALMSNFRPDLYFRSDNADDPIYEAEKLLDRIEKVLHRKRSIR